jgi:hypothetical protein
LIETRRIKGDLIEVFKILKRIDKVEEQLFFHRAVGSTRGHNLKLVKPVAVDWMQEILIFT